MYAPAEIATAAINATANRPGWNCRCANATADPTSTGVIDAVKEKGRNARHQTLHQTGLGRRASGLGTNPVPAFPRSRVPVSLVSKAAPAAPASLEQWWPATRGRR